MSCVSCKKKSRNSYYSSASSDEDRDFPTEATFYEYSDARPVYETAVSLLAEGDSLTFYGYIKANCERFSINFVTASELKDIALHINPRLPQNYIVRNTRVRNTWGREEVSSPLPFSLRRGSPFSIQVLVTDECYMISVNGHHFAQYAHRLSKMLVASVEVRGDVDNVRMVREEVNEYPERLQESEPKPIFLDIITKDSEVIGGDVTDGKKVMPKKWRLIHLGGLVKSTDKADSLQDMGLPLPYYGTVPPKTLTAGRCLKIEGRVKLLPHSFYINLQQGSNIWPHPTIAFHFNPRFSKHGGSIGQAVVCRNVWLDGHWGEEERSELNTNLLPGKTFSMIVDCGRSAFDVYVNGKLITTFQYQVDPSLVDTVYIQGDIKLWNVVVERSETVKKNLFENPTYILDDY